MPKASVGNYYVSVIPDMSKFNSSLAKGGGGLLRTIGSIGIGKALGDALSAGVNMFMGSLSNGISRIDTLNTFPRVMENVGISAEASSRAIATLSAGIDGLPTTLDAAASATQRFALQNGDVEASADMFLALNNAILAGGQSAAMQASALEQVSQAYAKGKPDMMEWRTMTMTMGPALKMVAESWGMSVDDMGEALRTGDRSMDDFLQTIQTLNTEGVGEFASLSEQASVSTQTIGTALANVGSRMSAVWASILDAIGTEDISNTINTLSADFKSFGVDVVAPIVGDVADRFRELASTVMSIDFSPILDAVRPFADVLMQFVSGEGPAFEGMMDRIQGHLTDLQPAISTLQFVWGGVVDRFGEFATAVAPLVAEFLGQLGSAVVGLLPIFANMLSYVGMWIQAFLQFGTMVANVAASIPGYFSRMVANVQTIFNNMVSFVQSIPQRIVGFFSGIGSRISSAIGSIHFPTPHVSWEGTAIPGLSLPHISWYANGGFVNGARLIGVGEKGTELIWPSYGAALNKYANAIAQRMPEGAGANVTNVYLNDLRVNDDERIRADVLNLVTDLGRYSAMNRG